MEWIAGKNVSRPRSCQPWQQYGINPYALVNRRLGVDEQRICRSARRIVSATHVDLDISKAMFRQMSLQGSQSSGSRHVRYQAQIELSYCFVRQNRFAAGSGIPSNQPLNVDRWP